MAIPAGFLDELRHRLGLAEVVGRRVRLIKKGREHEGLCPFHKEKTPSFTVNEEKGFYHCFGCGAHGSAFDFVMETEGLNFREAVEKLAGETGMQVPQDSPEERARSERRKSLYDVVEAATAHFEAQLRMPEGAEALKYLHGRSLSDETLKTFRLGFAPDRRDGISAALKKQNISEEQMLAAGLIIKRDDGSSYDRFRGRVIFPILDRRGRVVAFGGRILEGAADVGGKAPPKYLNSPETDLFHKGSLLYAMEKAQVAVRAGAPLIVTEGYMDVIALYQAGFQGAVAPLGTALTENQILELWKVAPEPVLCFDGDAAGLRAAAKAAERSLPLLRAGVGVRFATVPAGEDPDSLIKAQGPDAFKVVLDGAKPLSAVLWDMETDGKDLSSPEARAALQKRLEDHARHIQEPTLRSHFLAAFKDKIWARSRSQSQGGGRGQGGYQKGGYKRDWGRGQKQVGHPVYEQGQSAKALSGARLDLGHTREEIMLTTLIAHPDLYDEVCERLGTLEFSTPELDKMRQEALKTLAGIEGLDTDGFQRHLRQSGFSDILDSLMSSRVFGHAFFARPDTDPATALEGWDETYNFYRGPQLRAEIHEAEKHLASDMTPEASERLRLLKAQQLVRR